MSSGLSVCTAGRLGVVSPARISPIDLPQRQTLVPRRPAAPPRPADRRRGRRMRSPVLHVPPENPARPPLSGSVGCGEKGGVESGRRGQRSAGRRCGECDPSSPPGLLRCFHEVSEEALLRKQQTAEEDSRCAASPTSSTPLTPPTPAAGKPGHFAWRADKRKKKTLLSCKIKTGG